MPDPSAVERIDEDYVEWCQEFSGSRAMFQMAYDRGRLFGYETAEAAARDEVHILQLEVAELEAGTQYQPYTDRIAVLAAAALKTHMGDTWRHDDPDIRQCGHPMCVALAGQEDAGA